MAQLYKFGSEGVPSGVIALWHGLLANIPSGWVLCDGNNDTPDLRGLFVVGANAGVEPGNTGGAVSHLHAVNIQSGLAGGLRVNPGTSAGNASSPSHSHNVSGNTELENHLPPYYSVAFIMKT